MTAALAAAAVAAALAAARWYRRIKTTPVKGGHHKETAPLPIPLDLVAGPTVRFSAHDFLAANLDPLDPPKER